MWEALFNLEEFLCSKLTWIFLNFVGFGLIFGKVYKENYKISSFKEARPRIW